MDLYVSLILAYISIIINLFVLFIGGNLYTSIKKTPLGKMILFLILASVFFLFHGSAQLWFTPFGDYEEINEFIELFGIIFLLIFSIILLKIPKDD